ncbi:MAG: hypothetical protein B6245_00020 [Desulfobacteraceae bacterium 4572_88]|nr:MAG: hypothetical protein B6245_00020 [Desulfobacteraceae bacterium 4572_88]
MENTAKIIVVDDEKRICHNVEKILSKNNYEIVHALSAQDALEKMAKETFSLLISDIVMPGMNGLELLKMVKKQWPLTKALMMTAYASTDTAVKTIRLGALDYIPKPFTPDELRNKVGMALAGELREVTSTDAEREVIDVIDMDMPFETDEVAKYTGDDYAKMLTRSDMPIVEVPKSVPTETPEHFCKTGNMVCDMFKKLEGTCKGGLKTSKCPKLKAQKRKAAAAKAKGADPRTLVGIDMPFSYEEVVSVTGPEYVANLHHEGVSFLPYEQLKQRVEKMKHQIIDVDSPFDADEVAKQTGEAYAKSLGPSDMPVVEAPAAAETLEHFCEMGSMVCDIFKKMGGTCKAGIKKSECPKVRARMKKAAAQKAVFDSNRLISVDQPFDYEEVVAVTGAEYVANLHHDGMSVLPYEELKQNVSQMLEREAAQEALAAAADYPGLPKEPSWI